MKYMIFINYIPSADKVLFQFFRYFRKKLSRANMKVALDLCLVISEALHTDCSTFILIEPHHKNSKDIFSFNDLIRF